MRAVVPLVLAAVLAVARPARATPLPVVVERDSITVRAEAGLDDVATRVLDASAAQLARIAEDLPDLPAPGRVEIRIVRDAKDMESVSPGAVPVWAAGVTFPDAQLVVVAIRRGADVLDIDEVANHELAHIALGAALGDRAPRWLHEGFAYQHSAEWTWDRTETLAGMAWGNTIIPIAELDAEFPAQELPVSRAYAESYDFVGYLAHRGRWEDTDDDGDRWPFRKFLGLIGTGSTVDQAAIKAFGRPLEMLFSEWREDLAKRFVGVPAGVFSAGIWVLCGLLLTIAFLRRRRHNRRRIAEWDREDADRRYWLATLGIDADRDDDLDDAGGRPPVVELPN